MKMRLKTNYWKRTNTEEWAESVEKMAMYSMFCNLALAARGYYKEDIIIVIAAMIFCIMPAIIMITYNKHKTEEKNGKDRNTDTTE